MKASDLLVRCLETEGVRQIYGVPGEENAHFMQQNEFGRHTDLSFGNPDFLQLAAAFGWGAHRVERSRDLRGALEAAFEEEGPSLVIVPIDYRENALLTERLGNIACPI